MISGLLRAVHAPAWIVFAVIYGGYALMVVWTLINGYTRELTGWKHAGRPSKMHKVFAKWHTGLPVSLTRTTGEERHLRRAAGNTSRATPEGMVVLFNKWPRWARIVRNNVITALLLLWSCGMALNPGLTLQTGTVFVFIVLLMLISLWIAKLRRRYAQSPRAQSRIKRIAKETSKLPLPVRASRTANGESLAPDDPLQVLNEGPKLSNEVPPSVMANLLSEPLMRSPAEVERLLRQDPDQGTLRLPDTFAAMHKQREVIEEIIRNHQKGELRFSWRVTSNPRELTWVPIVTVLPRQVLFRDYLAEIGRCKLGETAVGVTAEGRVYITSHNGDTPWHLRSCGSGTGKSTGFQTKAVQILHNDPRAQLYCVDTKQVSFEPLKGLSRVHVFDDPESGMSDIWDVFYTLEDQMRKKYSAKRAGEASFEDFEHIWLLVDEGNDLANMLKEYWKTIRNAGDPPTPPIWSAAITPLINLGRQVNIRGEFMFQNMTDRALGGVSLRDSFGVTGMAGFKKNQWSRIIGTTPVPECKEGPGKILMVRGNEHTWVQGFYDEEKYLRAYATSGKGRNAA